MLPFLVAGGGSGAPRAPGVPATIKARALVDEHRGRAKLASLPVYSFVTGDTLQRGVGHPRRILTEAEKEMFKAIDKWCATVPVGYGLAPPGDDEDDAAPLIKMPPAGSADAAFVAKLAARTQHPAAAWRQKAQAFAAASQQGPMALLAFSF